MVLPGFLRKKRIEPNNRFANDEERRAYVRMRLENRGTPVPGAEAAIGLNWSVPLPSKNEDISASDTTSSTSPSFTYSEAEALLRNLRRFG